MTHDVEMTPARVAAVPGKRASGIAALAVMEQHLAGRDWFAADQFSIADVALYAYTHVADQGDFDLAPYPGITRWIDRVAHRIGRLAITEPFTTIVDPELTP